MLNLRRVAVAISGGVDSAVAALLLKNRGYDVQGVFMQNWDIIDEKGDCSIDADFADATTVCNILDIQLHKVNFVKEYWNEVFCNLIKEYETGYTPNPDVLCNRNIKFNYFYKFALNILKVDAVATGHYANTSFGSYLESYQPNTAVKLLKAKDACKDQMLFLCQVGQEPLRKTMFPLGNLMKSEVKLIASQNKLKKFAKKKESMGICFIGSRNFRQFIKEYIYDKPGDFVDIDNGKVVGQHDGIHQWTLGQRSCLSGLEEAYFTARKNVKENIIYVGKGTEHPLLYSRLFFTLKPYWIHSVPQEIKDAEILNCEFKFQHVQQWVPCKIFETEKGLIVELDKPKRAITPGQYAIFSRGNECLGSAKIISAGVSEFTLNYLRNRQKLMDKRHTKLHESSDTPSLTYEIGQDFESVSTTSNKL